MEWVIVTGADVDEATDKALDVLGVEADEVEVIVLAHPGRSLFGLRQHDARVQVRIKPLEHIRPDAQRRPAPRRRRPRPHTRRNNTRRRRATSA